jgi:hypothetical protein
MAHKRKEISVGATAKEFRQKSHLIKITKPSKIFQIVY